MSQKDFISQLLTQQGYNPHIISRAFQLFEQHQGTNYNIEELQKLAGSLVKMEKPIPKSQRSRPHSSNDSASNRRKSQPRIRRPVVSNPPSAKHGNTSRTRSRFLPILTPEEAQALKIGDKIDHRMLHLGPYFGLWLNARVMDKRGSILSIVYEEMLANHPNTCQSDYTRELWRFAKRDAVRRRPATQLAHLRDGDLVRVKVNPNNNHWIIARIFRQFGGQVEVRWDPLGRDPYRSKWVHLDDPSEVMPYSNVKPKAFPFRRQLVPSKNLPNPTNSTNPIPTPTHSTQATETKTIEVSSDSPVEPTTHSSSSAKKPVSRAERGVKRPLSEMNGETKKRKSKRIKLEEKSESVSYNTQAVIPKTEGGSIDDKISTEDLWKKLKSQLNELSQIQSDIQRDYLGGTPPRYQNVTLCLKFEDSFHGSECLRQLRQNVIQQNDSMPLTVVTQYYTSNKLYREAIVRHIAENGLYKRNPRILLNGDRVDWKQVIAIERIANYKKIPSLNGKLGLRAKRNIPQYKVLYQYIGTEYFLKEFKAVFDGTTEESKRNVTAFDLEFEFNGKEYEIVIDPLGFSPCNVSNENMSPNVNAVSSNSGMESSCVENPHIYVNHCSENSDSEVRTKEDMKNENVGLIQVMYKGYPYLFLVTKKRVFAGDLLLGWYGPDYLAAVKEHEEYLKTLKSKPN